MNAMNKRALISATQAVGLILAVGFLLVSAAAVGRLVGVFTKPVDQGSINTFNKLVNSVEILLDSDIQEDACKIQAAYVDVKYSIVGFNKQGIPNAAGQMGSRDAPNWGYVEENCGPIADDIFKPRQCLDRSCLCLCNGGRGDVTGNDCKDPTSTCKTVSSEIQRFRTVQEGGQVLDLVMYSKACFFGGAHKVIAGYIVRKKDTGRTIEIHQILSGEEMEEYEHIPDCESIIREERIRETLAETESQTTDSQQSGSSGIQVNRN